jgi:hypothetical protein
MPSITGWSRTDYASPKTDSIRPDLQVAAATLQSQAANGTADAAQKTRRLQAITVDDLGYVQQSREEIAVTFRQSLEAFAKDRAQYQNHYCSWRVNPPFPAPPRGQGLPFRQSHS